MDGLALLSRAATLVVLARTWRRVEESTANAVITALLHSWWDSSRHEPVQRPDEDMRQYPLWPAQSATGSVTKPGWMSSGGSHRVAVLEFAALACGPLSVHQVPLRDSSLELVHRPTPDIAKDETARPYPVSVG
jgi:hypothetical protein